MNVDNYNKKYKFPNNKVIIKLYIKYQVTDQMQAQTQTQHLDMHEGQITSRQETQEGNVDKGQQLPIQGDTHVQQKQTQQDQIIDPIEQLVKNNNIMPLLAVIDQLPLDRRVQDKPLLCIMATKFIPLETVLAGREIAFPYDQDRRTPLHYAIEVNDVKAAAWLISKGNPNQQDNFGNTPILDAIRLGRKRCFLLCMQNKLYDQRAPIFAAMHNRHWQLKLLYGMKVDIFKYRDEQNKSSFQRALQYCSFDCAQFMVRVNNNVDLQRCQTFTESKGLMRKLRNIKKQMSMVQSYKQLVLPLVIMLVILFGMSGSILAFGQTQTTPYETQRPFYLILFALLYVLYGLTYFFGSFYKSNVQYRQKNTLYQILQSPSDQTIEEICPICVHLTDFTFNHCYTCGCCIQKYHFHSFTCINKSNQVFWVMTEIVWLYLLGTALNQFSQFMLGNSIGIASVSSFTVIRFIASLDYLLVQEMYFAFLWFLFLMLTFLYQLFYTLSILGMMCMRRKYQEVIHSENYLHLYEVVKINDNFVNKQKKIFQRGLLKGLIRCVRNVLLYFFIED